MYSKIAQIAERERLERIRQGYLVEGGEEIPKVGGRIQEPSFNPASTASSPTPTVHQRTLPSQSVRLSYDSNVQVTSELPLAFSDPTTTSNPTTKNDPSAATSREDVMRLSEKNTQPKQSSNGETSTSDLKNRSKTEFGDNEPGPSTLLPRKRGNPTPTRTEGQFQVYSIPTPPRRDISPSRTRADPEIVNSQESLRKLSEEDTKRRMVESGVDIEPGKEKRGSNKLGVENVGLRLGSGGLIPRRRGKG